MDRETAKQEIRENWEPIIQGITYPARQNVNGHTSYVCPLCGHGEHGDGLTINPRSSRKGALKCFGCGFSGDILDLLQEVNNCDFNTALNVAAGELGLIVDYRTDAAADFGSLDAAGPAKGPERADKEKGRETPTGTAKAPLPGPSADYTAYYKECIGRLKDPAAVSYLTARGISPETAAACGVGYDPQADPAGAPGAIGDAPRLHPAPRLIIPTGPAHYVGRSIDPSTPPNYQKMNPKGGSPGIFNSRALMANKTVFVTEGAFDALSFVEAGAAAVATNSKNNGQALINLLQKGGTKAQQFIICPDNDPNPTTNAKTQQQAQELCQKIRAAGFLCIVSNVAGQYHDANDAIRADRAAFTRAISTAFDEMYLEAQKGTKPDNVSYYIKNLMGEDLARFRKDIKTGFANLDREAGGLYSGLYVIAAISSLGKTTFTHQLGDNIAAAGNDVLFFSLEQSRLELVTKSIARWTAKKDLSTAVTSLAIRKGYLPQHVADAAREYSEAVGDRFSVIEGNFNCTVSFIGDYIRGYMARNKAAETGEKPVVIIDYLQVISADKDPETGRKMTDTKQITDHNITELKRISRDLDITIILISSVNRANYLTPIDFESLKESGGIEYTADVVWGLQLQCLNGSAFESEKNIKEKRDIVKRAKAANPRKIELVCLKNRYGISSYACGFNYYPAADLFTEDDGREFYDDLGENETPVML